VQARAAGHLSKSVEAESLSSSHRDGRPEVVLEEDFVMAGSSIPYISSLMASHKPAFLQPTW